MVTPGLRINKFKSFIILLYLLAPHLSHAQSSEASSSLLGRCGAGLISVAGSMGSTITSILSGCARCAMIDMCNIARTTGMETILNACGVTAATGLAFGDVVESSRTLASALSTISSSGVNMGAAISGSAFAGVSASINIEAACIGNRVQLYCAPGIGMASDVGVSLQALGLFRTLGCSATDNYSGGFLTFNAGVSFEAAAVPLFASLNVGIGLNNTATFPAHLVEYLVSHPDDVSNMFTSLSNLSTTVSTMGPIPTLVAFMAVQLIASNTTLTSEQRTQITTLATTVRAQLRTAGLDSPTGIMTALRNLPELSLRNVMRSTLPALRSAGLTGAEHFFEFLAGRPGDSSMPGELSGCDGIGPGFGLGVSAAPASVGFGLSEYHTLGPALDLNSIGLSCTTLGDAPRYLNLVSEVLSGRTSCDTAVTDDLAIQLNRFMQFTQWASETLTSGCDALGATRTVVRAYGGGAGAAYDTLPPGLRSMIDSVAERARRTSTERVRRARETDGGSRGHLR